MQKCIYLEATTISESAIFLFYKHEYLKYKLQLHAAVDVKVFKYSHFSNLHVEYT